MATDDGPPPGTPGLTWAFSAAIDVAAPIEQGLIDGARERFIPILGGRVFGPRLHGAVLAGGGDWQVVRGDGRTELRARYFVRADDGTVIAIDNPGMRVAPPEVIDRLARGDDVAPGSYYSAGTPRFRVADSPHSWLRDRIFVARGVRRPQSLTVGFFTID